MNQHYEKFCIAPKVKEFDEIKYTYGLNISYSWRFTFLFGSKFEIKPGVTLGDLDLMGIDLGIYIRQYFVQDFFVMLGSQFHLNMGFKESSMYSGKSSLGGIYVFPGGSIGYRISKKITLLLGYYKSLKSSWRDTWALDVMSSYSSETYEKIKWMVKFGIELNL
jgi:hypothetical protein